MGATSDLSYTLLTSSTTSIHFDSTGTSKLKERSHSLVVTLFEPSKSAKCANQQAGCL